MLLAFAEQAARHRYARPEMRPAGEPIDIRDGRHPVVERAGGEPFVPNDTELDRDGAQIVLLTGPNMGGKSTYLRQVALIVLMAQTGSFVPADSARIGVVDRIFTRVGASDDLTRGESTFMVEMTETANILHHAHRRQPGDPRRDRPRHRHLRRPLAGLGDRRAPARASPARGRSSPPTTTS